MELNDILAKYESEENFEFYDLSSDLGKLSSEDNSLAVKAECLAMAFSEGGHDDWETFYGPTITWTVKSTGELVYSPDKKEITKEILEYWYNRTEETSNPLLKMRYTGLLWDFSKNITGKEADFKTVKLVFIRSVFDIIKKDKLQHCMTGLVYLNIAIERAISLRQSELINEGMKLLLGYVSKYADDSKPGIWAEPLSLLTKHNKALADFEMEIVKDNKDRLERLFNLCKEKGCITDSYAHVLLDEAKLLADYYKNKKQQDCIFEVLDKALVGIRLSFKLKGAMWAQTMLQKMQDVFRKFSFDKQANSLYQEIQDLGSTVFEEMTPKEYSVPIDGKVFDDYLEKVTSGSIKEVLDAYTIEYLPKMDVEIERQKKEKELTPLLDMIHTVIYDWTGMPISDLGSGKNAEKNKLSYGIYRRMIFFSFYMQLHIRKMEEKKLYTYDSIIERFNESPFIVKEQREQFERGIKAYFDSDFLVACHLLVPIFESAIRRLAAYSGINVFSLNKDEDNEYKTLDILLKNLKEDKRIPTDIYEYFQNLFTDKYGWNIRNLISHGLLQTGAFNKTMADRIVHAFLTLSLIKVIPVL